MAIVFGVKKFHQFLAGRTFTIISRKDVDKGGLGGLKPPSFLHALIMADLLEVSTCTPGSVLYVESQASSLPVLRTQCHTSVDGLCSDSEAGSYVG